MALKYLLDTSVIKRLSRPAVRRAVEPLAEAGAVARTQITDLEVGYSARNETEWQRLMVALSAFDLIESTHRIIAARLESSAYSLRVVSAVAKSRTCSLPRPARNTGWSFYITTRTSISSPP